MGRRHFDVAARQDQGEIVGVITAGFDADGIAGHRPNVGAIRPFPGGFIEVIQIEITLIVRTGKPLRRYATVTAAARHVHSKGSGHRGRILDQGLAVHLSAP